MIKASKLKKSFADLDAVSELSFDIPGKQVTGLLGPNGAGKTTTIRMLTTFLAPDSGDAEIAGFSVVKDSDRVRENIGYQPENPPLFPEMTVLEYLNFVGKIKKLSASDLKENLARVLHRCLLEDVAHKACFQLSKGYRQRVGLAQAIIHKPAVVILDEPTSGLDPSQIVEIRNLIKELGDNHSVIISTHNLAEVVATCSQALILSSGKLVSSLKVSPDSDSTILEQEYLKAVSGSNLTVEEGL